MPLPTTIHGLLIDLDGVLYVGETPVPGAQQVLKRLDDENIPRRYLTNTTTRTAASVVQKLRRLGFSVFSVHEEEVFSPISATVQFLNGLGRPTINPVVRDSVLPAFADFPRNNERPDYVIIGDIGAAWSYPPHQHHLFATACRCRVDRHAQKQVFPGRRRTSGRHRRVCGRVGIRQR
jgi:hypothetical protein